MLCIYGAHHIPTVGNASGRRACRAHTGFFMGHEEARRAYREGMALVCRRRRFAWIARQWRRHLVEYRAAKEVYR